MQFFGEKLTTDDTLQEETSRSNQFPEEMWTTMDMAIWEPDALQRIDILKENNDAGNTVQSVLDGMA